MPRRTCKQRPSQPGSLPSCSCRPCQPGQDRPVGAERARPPRATPDSLSLGPAPPGPLRFPCRYWARMAAFQPHRPYISRRSLLAQASAFPRPGPSPATLGACSSFSPTPNPSPRTPSALPRGGPTPPAAGRCQAWAPAAPPAPPPFSASSPLPPFSSRGRGRLTAVSAQDLAHLFLEVFAVGVEGGKGCLKDEGLLRGLQEKDVALVPFERRTGAHADHLLALQSPTPKRPLVQHLHQRHPTRGGRLAGAVGAGAAGRGQSLYLALHHHGCLVRLVLH